MPSAESYVAQYAQKLTITINEAVYRELHDLVGQRRISRFRGGLAKTNAEKPRLSNGIHRLFRYSELD